eukprot:jgi/Botrbrau1/11941/Bobra.341_1s0008.1
MSGKMKQEPQTVARRKVVVRNLPPLVSEADVKAVIEAAAAGKYDWFRFLQGKAKTSKIKPARAFLHFIDPRDVLSFKTHMEKHTFVNERGQVFQCNVEFAPSQEMPVPQKKRDRRENTLDKDEDFLHFVEAYEKELNDTTSMLKVQKFGVPNPGSGAPSTVPLKSNLMLALENRLPRSRGIIREYVNENAQSAQQSKPLKPEVSGSHPKKAAPKAEARPAVLRPPSGQREAVSSKSTRESSTEGARSQGVEPERRAERVRRVKEGAQVYVPRALRGDTQASGGASTPAKDSAADANMNGMMKAPGNRSEAQGLAPLIAGAGDKGCCGFCQAGQEPVDRTYWDNFERRGRTRPASEGGGKQN